MKFLKMKLEDETVKINPHTLECIDIKDDEILLSPIRDTECYWTFIKLGKNWYFNDTKILNFEELKKQIDEL